MTPSDLVTSQTVVLGILSEEEDEERAPHFDQGQLEIDLKPDLLPDEHVRWLQSPPVPRMLCNSSIWWIVRSPP